jgi:hypothetical protein
VGEKQEGEKLQDELVAVHTDRVTTERMREAGPVHVGHQLPQVDFEKSAEDSLYRNMDKLFIQMTTSMRFVLGGFITLLLPGNRSGTIGLRNSRIWRALRK